MHKAPFVLFLLLLLPGCSGNESREIPPGDRAALERWAGRLAPVMVLPDSMVDDRPTPGELGELFRICDSDPDCAVLFYDLLVDSIADVPMPEGGPEQPLPPDSLPQTI